MADQHGYPTDREKEFIIDSLAEVRSKINEMLVALNDNRCTVSRVAESLPFQIRNLQTVVNYANDTKDEQV